MNTPLVQIVGGVWVRANQIISVSADEENGKYWTEVEINHPQRSNYRRPYNTAQEAMAERDRIAIAVNNALASSKA